MSSGEVERTFPPSFGFFEKFFSFLSSVEGKRSRAMRFVVSFSAFCLLVLLAKANPYLDSELMNGECGKGNCKKSEEKHELRRTSSVSIEAPYGRLSDNIFLTFSYEVNSIRFKSSLRTKTRFISGHVYGKHTFGEIQRNEGITSKFIHKRL